MCWVWLMVWSWRLILSCNDFKSFSCSYSATILYFLIILYFFFSIPQLLIPAKCHFTQFTQLDSFGHLLVLSLVWSSSPQFRQAHFLLRLAFVCPYLWQLWHIMGWSWFSYTAVSDGFQRIMIVYGCPCRLKVWSTPVVLEFLDLIKLGSFEFSMN